MLSLGDKNLEYKPKMVRANSLENGDVAEVDGERLVVLRVEKRHFQHNDDGAEIFAAIQAAGARDKVSKDFDESTLVEYGKVTFEGDLANPDETVAVAEKVVRRYTEWDLVTCYV